MSRAVYSTLFLTSLNTTGTLTYDVPGGDVAILRHMTCHIPHDHPSGVGIAITVGLDDPSLVVWELLNGPIMGGVYEWSGWQVFTHHLYLIAGTVAYAFRASGTLLTPT